MQKALAGNECLEKVLQSLVGISHFLTDPVDRWPVPDLDFAAKRVGHQLVGEVAGE